MDMSVRYKILYTVQADLFMSGQYRQKMINRGGGGWVNEGVENHNVFVRKIMTYTVPRVYTKADINI